MPRRRVLARTRWIEALAAHPELLQRPIITGDDGTTVIGRSAEAVRRVLGERPRRERATVRVLLLDDRVRILLFQDSDPGVAGSQWWILPGGGIDPGEDELSTVLREVQEETGLTLDAGRVRGPIARRHVIHGYSDQVVEQDDTFYVAAVAAFEVSTAGHTVDEQATLLQHRWWTRAEIESTSEQVWPVLLPELLDLVEAPDDWPRQLDEVEESSLRVGTAHDAQPRSSPG